VLVAQCKKLEKLILDTVEQDEACQLFMTIPGVGPLTALAYKTYVDRPQRFQKSKSVGASLGLTPRKYASGEVDYNGPITKCGDAFLRMHLFEAAKVLLSRTTKPSDLKSWGLRIAKRSSNKKACVAVARRLAVIMHAMWRDGTVFQSTEVQANWPPPRSSFETQERFTGLLPARDGVVRQDEKTEVENGAVAVCQV